MRGLKATWPGATPEPQRVDLCVTWLPVGGAVGTAGTDAQLPWGQCVFDTSGIGVFLGMDVGKGEHHAHGLTPAGKTVHDKRMPNSEPKLRALFEKLKAKFPEFLSSWARTGLPGGVGAGHGGAYGVGPVKAVGTRFLK